MPPPLLVDALSVTAAFLTVSVPKLSAPAPLAADPAVMVMPDMVAVVFALTSMTPMALLPLIVTWLAPGPAIATPVVVLASTSVLPVRIIVCGVANAPPVAVLKTTVLGAGLARLAGLALKLTLLHAIAEPQ